MDDFGFVKDFLKAHGHCFSFDWLGPTELQRLLSAAAAALNPRSHTKVEDRLACLSVLRLLSRDKACCEAIAATDVATAATGKPRPHGPLLLLLLTASGLSEFAESRGDVVAIPDRTDLPEHVEALKVLCNLVFNNESGQAFCRENNVVNAIIQRSKTYEVPGVDYQIKVFDMRLLFIITALCVDVRSVVCVELDGVPCLSDVLDSVLKGSLSSGHLDDNAVELVVHVLKALYNVTLGLSPSLSTASSENSGPHIRLLCQHLRSLLAVKTLSGDKQVELTNHVVNLMINIPPAAYDEFLQPLPESGASKGRLSAKANGISTDVVDAILKFLYRRLNSENDKGSLPSLIPAMAVLTTFCRGSPAIRRHCRIKVLPFLKDEVKQLPQEGNTLRNRLCALLTLPNTDVSGAAAELLYVLCKESVGRLIKYSGFGNAAGLLAQRGLLSHERTKRGGVTSSHSSSSEDSDTEVYKELEPDVNPVTGRWEPAVPGNNPMDNMSEEQKEYEAVKLVELMHQLAERKIIQPATIGADGQPKAVEHVLEFTANMAAALESSDESD